MRVIHVVPRDGYGGVESAARSMAARETLACEFKLLFITGPSLTPDCPRIVTSPYDRWYHPGAYRQAYSKILSFAPDVAVFSLWRSVPLLIALRILRPGIRIVFTINSEHCVHPVEAFLVWWASRLSDEIWCDIETTLAKRVRKEGQSGRVISFVTEGSRLEPVAAAVPSLHFICWARLDPQKGLDRALRLIAALRALRSDVRFDVYGPDDGEGASLIRQFRRLTWPATRSRPVSSCCQATAKGWRWPVSRPCRWA